MMMGAKDLLSGLVETWLEKLVSELAVQESESYGQMHHSLLQILVAYPGR